MTEKQAVEVKFESPEIEPADADNPEPAVNGVPIPDDENEGSK